jgi:hypothetical protein
MDLIASKEHAFGDQIDWRDPHLHVPLDIREKSVHIGMYAASHGYADVLEQWFHEGGHPVQIGGPDRMSNHHKQQFMCIGLRALQSIMKNNHDGGEACMGAWLRSLDRHHEDVYQHINLFWKAIINEIQGPDPSSRDLSPHGHGMQRCVASIINAGVDVFSLNMHLKDPVLYKKDRFPVEHPRLKVGDIIAGIPVKPDDHGLIVTQALLHRMGYEVPHWDEGLEQASMRTPIGTALAHRFVVSIDDPIVMANWISFLDM